MPPPPVAPTRVSAKLPTAEAEPTGQLLLLLLLLEHVPKKSRYR